MRSRADLVNEALDVLGAVPTGQAPEVEDVEKVDGKVDAFIASTAAQEIADVDVDQIDDEVFNQLAILLADSVKSKFGLTADERANLTTDATQARMELQQITRNRPKGGVLKTEYF